VLRLLLAGHGRHNDAASFTLALGLLALGRRHLPEAGVDRFDRAG